MMSGTLTRRRFLKGSSGLIALSLTSLRWPGKLDTAQAAPPRKQVVTYRRFEDLFRANWTWDRVAKGTHHVNCWYQRCCNWNVFVKDGIVWREEQAGTYPQTNESVPDFNPRGCQKGACFSERMYDASRIRYPLRRAGARGEGRWKRVSWDEALREIADKTLDVLAHDGATGVIWDEGSGGSNLGVQRTHTVLDTPVLETDSEFGDHHPGAAVTCGKISFASSADDLFHSDLILIWGGNPTITQIPNAHFIQEARYHGARVVTIAPDYSASAIHADLWIPLNVASDAALGLSLAHVLIEENLYDAEFVTEQTDLPLLVRTDTRRLLRPSDIEPNGRSDRFYFYDPTAQTPRQASPTSLELGSCRPALEGTFSVSTYQGEVEVTTVFELLRKQLAAYTPEAAGVITGISPKTIRTLARMLAHANAATCITQSNFGKFYHGLEMERAQFLAFALAGQFGKKGSGINAFPNLWLTGHEGLIAGSGFLPPKLGLVPMGLKAAPELLRMKWEGYTPEMVMYELVRRKYALGGQANSNLFLYFQAGLEDLYGGAKRWDTGLPRDFQQYLDEAFENGWQINPRGTPRIFFEVGGNYLGRNRAHTRILSELFSKLELIVTLDWRMSFTALHSDFVLPAAGYYEQDTIPWTTPITPFTQVTTRAVPPLGESKSDWEFHCVFLKALQERAVEHNVQSFTDLSGNKRRLDSVYENFTFQRKFTEENERALWDEALALATNVGDVTFDELAEKGFQRYTETGGGYLNMGNATDIEPNETITANSWHTEKKRPWPTLTRRMQFYIDHELYLELGEELPVHKDLPPIGGNYPLQMNSGHTRWSIHAAWREDLNLLRLQRGEPCVFLSVEDAAARRISDGDPVRVYNDIDTFELAAKLSPAVRPGEIIIYHAWEPHQFKAHKTQQALTPNPMNPIQLAGGYFHLQPRLAVGTPGASDRGTRVEVERLG